MSDLASLELRPGRVEERTPVLADLMLERASVATGGGFSPAHHARWHVNRGIVNPDCPLCPTPAEQR